eukprot:TRINITY_DN1726_c1_g1_i1.p1 TRINITY_DN1726_c1_g1~~TRINITY_DN1726_c1_g1_i1.p1  ORF type:complete len:713 (+),score=113.03 TRINITY_DN1726_c1_g1_i1:2754-4892(+)
MFPSLKKIHVIYQYVEHTPRLASLLLRLGTNQQGEPMKIRPEQLEALRREEELRSRSQPEKTRKFGDMLAQEVRKGDSPEAAEGAKPPGRAEAAQAADAVQKVDRAEADQPPTTEREVMDTLDHVFDKWEQYAHSLRRMQEEGDLRQAYGVLEDISNDVEGLKAAAGGLEQQNPSLQSMVDSLEILTVTERFKFNRGDYLQELSAEPTSSGHGFAASSAEPKLCLPRRVALPRPAVSGNDIHRLGRFLLSRKPPSSRNSPLPAAGSGKFLLPCPIRISEGVAQHLQTAFQHVLRYGQRYKRADYIAIPPLRQHHHAVGAALPGHGLRRIHGRGTASAIFHQLDTQHGAHAADIADYCQLPGPAFEPRAHCLAQPFSLSQNVFGFHDIQHCQGRGAGDGIAAKGGAQTAWLHGVHHLRAPHHRGKHHPPGQAFAQGNNVRCEIPVLAGQHDGGAAYTCLDLVHHHEDAVLAADGVEFGKVLRRRCYHAAQTGYRFGHEACDSVRIHVGLEEIMQMVGAGNTAGGILQTHGAAIAVGVRHAVDFWRIWSKPFLDWLHFAGQAHRHVGAAVEIVLEGDDCAPARGAARYLYGILHGFSSGVEQHRFLVAVSGGELAQPLCQGHIALVLEHVKARMYELLTLFSDSLRHPRVAMSDVACADAAGEIDELAPLHIQHHTAQCAQGKDVVQCEHSTRNNSVTTGGKSGVGMRHDRGLP